MCVCDGIRKQGLVEVLVPTMISSGPVTSVFWNSTFLCKLGLIFTLG